MSDVNKKHGTVKQRQTTLNSFTKRKSEVIEESGNCSSTTSLDQMVPSESNSHSTQSKSHGKVKFNFDFTSDPLLQAMQRKVTNNEKRSDESEEDFSVGRKREKGIQSNSPSQKTSLKKKKLNNHDQPHHPASFSDFKTASGRPVDKEVRNVTSSEVNTSSQKGRDREQRYLGSRRIGTMAAPFRTPLSTQKDDDIIQCSTSSHGKDTEGTRTGWKADESLKHFDENIIDLIESEIMSQRGTTTWQDIAGLEKAKKALREIVVLPFLRPDIFTGIRAPPKGVLLFGPPGTGKTMIGRCVAAQCNATFFNIAASSLTSKWVGEGEKLVRVLFAIARLLQPSIIFIDEIDSLLTSRKEGEHESSRRIKTEFLVHLDGVATFSDEKILVLGATNRPYELDDAAKRRFAKRLYISLPCEEARMNIVKSLLQNQKHDLSDDDLKAIAKITEGYSGADMKQLCAEASMGPIRDILRSSSVDIATVDSDEVRAITVADFEDAVQVVRATVIEQDLLAYRDWDSKFGSLNLS